MDVLVPLHSDFDSLNGDESFNGHRIHPLGTNRQNHCAELLVDREGKVTALIVGVGGFLGAGEKDVAIPFNAVHATTKNHNKWYLVMNSNKDALKNAKGFKYDRNAMTWVPEGAPTTTGSLNAR
jgi:PRC-barrel domain